MNAFKRNLLIGYGISLLLLIGSSVASYISIKNLLASAAMVNHTNIVINKLESVISVLKDAETGTRGFLLTGNDVFLEPYTGAQNKAVAFVDETKTLTADNPEQQVDCDLLKSVANQRLNILTAMVAERRGGGKVSESVLLQSKAYMDNARHIVNNMQQREGVLLKQRGDNLNKFTETTPIFIIIASLLAILVTAVSFFRVLKDYNKREELQRELFDKDAETGKRIKVIQDIAGQISTGNYKLKVADEGADALGGIADALNKMSESLNASFTSLSQKEWLQTGIAELNEGLIGEKNLASLTQKVLGFVSAYTASQTGAFYLLEEDKSLRLSAGVALNADRLKVHIGPGEGLAGHTAQTGKETLVQNIQDPELTVDYSGGSLKPKAIFVVPVYYEAQVKGVMEIASLSPYDAAAIEFVKVAAYNAGIAVNSAIDHQCQQDLLHETQAQSEELQTQHEELQNMNTELMAQAEKLQASEEELRVQQEELQQANQELEERSRLLEERNELILERNLEIQAKAEELAISTKYKSEFLANMSHELRTPLNSILLLSRLLSDNHEGNLSGDQVEYAAVIQASGKGLLTLIDEILDLSKIEAGKMDLEWSNVSIETVSKEISSLFAPIAKEKGLAFTVEADGGIASVETDKLRLEQILRNLISNALKFTKKGSVALKMEKQSDAVAFTVVDTGIGIATEKQQTIFEAFQQADGSTRRQFGGTGLGLSISRELAKLLGGEIKLKSEEGQGSEFTLLLPLHQGQTIEKPQHSASGNGMKMPQADAAVNENAPSQFISQTIPEAIPDDRDKITAGDKILLIIEDDTAFAKIILDYTRKQGYKGVVAVRGDEGIALARSLKPAGILLDIQLPVRSGWEVMDELKGDAATRHIPVHMMSSVEAKNKSLTKGAVDFINKPVAFEQLGEVFKKIEQALNRHPKKVLIVEENPMHAKALAYFLENYNVATEVKNSIGEGVKALNRNEVDCVILDMGIPAHNSYEVLEDVKKTPGFENLPIIIFTGKNLSHIEERKIKRYADSIVIKTAQSYQRILDEVSLFLHLVEENKKNGTSQKARKLGRLSDVLNGKTVLIVDDDVRNIFSLTKSLEGQGVNVVSAVDGEDALVQLKEAGGKVDLVLMDMMMPEMDGYESTRQIRANAAYRALPVIAVTAKAMTGDREKCIAAGASDYITKPVDVDQLLSLLRVWLYE